AGQRFIRAASVDGSMHPSEIEKVLEQYKSGELDMLTYVNMLLEGWDSPESDFTVLIRPTKSKVLAEQRMGRIVRSREGKVATVHEFIYAFESFRRTDPQITHMD